MSIPRFTDKQGQYLAFIHTYHLLHREAPSQVEIADFFGVQPGSVASMLSRLEAKGLLSRQAGVGRSLRVTVPAGDLPPLEDPIGLRPTVPASEGATVAEHADIGPIYQCRIDLNGVQPPIWRRVLFPAEISMYGLHRIVQAAMGWEDAHLHDFDAGGEVIGPIDPDNTWGTVDVDEDTVSVRDVLTRPGEKIKYTYDFGDSWVHTIKLERILAPDPGIDIYPVCIKGRRACPPEDVGGIYGYAYSMEALADPDDEEHQRYVDWYGGDWDPEYFSLEDVNNNLAAIPPSALYVTPSTDMQVHRLTMIRPLMLSEDHGVGLYAVAVGMQGTPPDPSITDSINRSKQPEALLAQLQLLRPAHWVGWMRKASTFGREMGSAIIQHLVTQAGTVDPTWRWQAEILHLTLMDFAPEILPDLMAAFDRLDDYAKSLTCMLLGRLGADAYVPAILRHLDAMRQEPESGFFLGPLWALVDLNRPEAADTLLALLDDGEIFDELCAMLGRAGDMRAAPALLLLPRAHPELAKQR